MIIFPGQKPDEKIELIIRKHWFVYVIHMIKFFFLMLIPTSILTSIFITNSQFFNTQNGLIVSLITVIYTLFVVLSSYITWLKDTLDVMIVTDRRLIGIDQVGFLNRRISEAALNHIQDIECEQKGGLENIFNFGLLEIQTAADKIIFRINYIHEPQLQCRKILDIRDKSVKVQS